MQSAPIREFKPVVVPTDYLVWAPGCALIVAPVVAFVVAMLTDLLMMLLRTQEFQAPEGLAGDVGGVAFFASIALVLIAYAVSTFIAPGRTSYRIFADRIEVESGVWTRSNRTFVLDDVTDIQMNAGPFQRARRAGTITVTVARPPVTGEAATTGRSFTLGNVPEPQAVYELLRSLTMEKGKR